MVTNTRDLYTVRPGILAEHTDMYGSEVVVSVPPHTEVIGSETITGYRSLSSAAALNPEMTDTRELRRSIQRQYQHRFDTGHDMELNRRRYDPATPFAFSSTSPLGYTRSYSGSATIRSYIGDPPPLGAPSVNELSTAGSKAFAACAPTRPEASLAQFIGELHEGLPRALGRSLESGGGSLQSIGEEHLNTQFGARPLLSDLHQMAEGVLNANKRLAQLRKDSGGIIHRRRDIAQNESGESYSWDDTLVLHGVSYPSSFMSDDRVRVTATDSVTNRLWFSGAYSYHLVEAIGFAGRMEAYNQQAEALLGLQITPDVVWELTPWSWLVDYFADVGGFLSNATLLADDTVVARYGYVMCHSVATRHVVASGAKGLDGRPIGGFGGAVMNGSNFIERKSRIGSTPYGFGINMENLSPARWAILGALGMTRSGR
jgi:hypothetical protein